MIISYLKKHLNRKLLDKLDFSAGYIVEKEELEGKTGVPGLFLFSTYLWNIHAHLNVSARIKQESPDSLVIFGGPFIPRDRDEAITFLMENNQIDYLVHGEGEEPIFEIVKSYLTGVMETDISGISCRSRGEILYNGVASVENLNELASPYLSGEFDKYKKEHDIQVVSLEMSRGCPFRCAFCDWGQSTNSRIREFDLHKIYGELEWVGQNKIPIIELTDSNFGILARDVDITRKICETKRKYGYPKEICANFAKNIHGNVIEIIKMTKEAGLVSQAILSIQTLYPETLQIIERKNLNEAHYRKSLESFRELDLPVTIELMLGLPGCTTQSFKDDLQWACDFNLGVYVHSTILIPNTQIASKDFKEEYGIVTAAESNLKDPRYLREIGLESIKDNQVVSLKTLPQLQFIDMMKLTSVFHIFYGESILKYIMFFLRQDYGIRQIDFLNGIQSDMLHQYPKLRKIRDMADAPASTIAFVGDEDILWNTVVNNRWGEFYGDVKRYILEKYDIEEDDEFHTVVDIQQHVLGYYGRTFPGKRIFDFDFISYFKDKIGKSDSPTKLRDYRGKCKIIVTDPLNICSKEVKPDYYEPHHGHIELSSQLNKLRFGFDLNDLRDDKGEGVQNG